MTRDDLTSQDLTSQDLTSRDLTSQDLTSQDLTSQDLTGARAPHSTLSPSSRARPARLAASAVAPAAPMWLLLRYNVVLLYCLLHCVRYVWRCNDIVVSVAAAAPTRLLLRPPAREGSRDPSLV